MKSSESLLRPMTACDLPQVLCWRNHPAIREHMFSRQEIDPKEHRGWFERSQTNPIRELLIYERNDVPMGFVSFDGLLYPNVVEWGFYVAPNAPRGTGSGLGRAALQHAFVDRSRHKVAARTIDTNARALRFHTAFGFLQEGTLRDHFFDGSTYRNVICFGLLQTEWQATNGKH